MAETRPISELEHIMMEIGCNRQPEREALLAMEKLEEMETMKSNTMGNLEVALRPPRKRKKANTRRVSTPINKT